jgi:hypothetical protein
MSIADPTPDPAPKVRVKLASKDVIGPKLKGCLVDAPKNGFGGENGPMRTMAVPPLEKNWCSALLADEIGPLKNPAIDSKPLSLVPAESGV